MGRYLCRLTLVVVSLIACPAAFADTLVDDFSSSPFASGRWCEREHAVTWRSGEQWMNGSNADCCSANNVGGNSECVPGTCYEFMGESASCGGICGIAGESDIRGCEHLLISSDEFIGDDRAASVAFNVQTALSFGPASGCTEPVENVKVVSAAHPNCDARIEARVIRLNDGNPEEYALEIRSVTSPLSGHPECDEFNALAQRINQPIETSTIDAAARFPLTPSSSPAYELSLLTTPSPTNPGAELRAAAEVVDLATGQVLATASRGDLFRPAWYDKPGQGRRFAIGGARDAFSAPHIFDSFEGYSVIVPPDPTQPGVPNGAPPVLNTSVATTVKDSTSFLYLPSDPNEPTLQTDFDDPDDYISPSKIELKRAAVIHGLVRGDDGLPLSGVSITILEDRGYGRTRTRADGQFDMAVNGGSRLTVVYEKAGFLTSHRQVDVPWQEYVNAPEVVMVAKDPVVTTVNLAGATAIQVARGSQTPDGDGEGPEQARTATMLFLPGTTATMTIPGSAGMPDQQVQLDQISVRATEYTVGADGPKRMPAELPPDSAYTYAVELGIDEADAAGATRVDFPDDKPVIFYVENFLGFAFMQPGLRGWTVRC